MIKETGTTMQSSLSVSQRSRWFYQLLNPSASGALNSAFAVTIHGLAPKEAIGTALLRVIDHHPMLRVQVSQQGGETIQTVTRVTLPPLRDVDAQHLSSDELRDRLVAACEQPFMGGREEPLVRATLFRCSLHKSILLLVFDHLVVDGWSYFQLLDEFADLVSKAHEPRAATAVQQRPAYFDYIDSQRKWLATDEAAKQKRYWKDSLADPPALQLPCDHARPQHSTGREGRITTTIPVDLVDRLKTLARQESATLFVTLASAFQILLHKHSGQNDIVVGIPMPGRIQSEWDDIVGDFVNPIALRTRFAAEATVRSIIRDVRGVALRGMANQQYPFSMVVEDLASGRESKEHPVFQTMFAFQNAREHSSAVELISERTDSAPVSWAGMMVTPCPVPYSGRLSNVPLILEAIESGGEIRCAFKYDPDLFESDTVQRMTARFARLLDGMVSTPSSKIAQLDILPSAERQELLAFSGLAQDYPHDTLMHLPFEARVADRPDSTAVVYQGTALSYSQLNVKANQLAHLLIEQGVKSGQCVAVCLERGVTMVAALLGVLKAGGAYVPLDPTLPPQRAAEVLADCGAVALITQSRFLGPVGFEVSRIEIDDPAQTERLASMSSSNPDHRALGIHPGQLAYVIYTSGSTGNPKGVMIEHAGIPRIFGAAQPRFQFGPDDVWTLFHSFGFDFSVWEMWGALLHGGRLVIVPMECARDPWAFYDLLCMEQVTVLSQTPSAFRQLVTAQAESSAEHCLRQIIFAGEALELHTLARWFERNDRARTKIVNMYGATESTVHATFYEVPPDGDVTSLRGICGRPLAGYRIYVLDADRRPVPIGATGEIYIGGRCVARGYMNRPELNVDRFTRDALDPDPNSRLYKTGDLGRFTSSGELEFLGRNDFQVKIRGFRIELGEIETKLAACYGVRDAVVVIREDVPGDRRLVAYVTTDNDGELSVFELREQLLRSLPAYMVPSAVVLVPVLPLTDNGKLDRSALPPPESSVVASRTYEALEGPVENALATLWMGLLGVGRVGRQDEFFDLGGDSLHAVQLVRQIRETFGIEMSMHSLFEHPILISMADYIVSQQLGEYSAEDVRRIEDELRSLPEERLRAIVTKGETHG